MLDLDEIAKSNQKRWKRAVAEGDRFTQPWLDLDNETVRGFLEDDQKMLPDPYSTIYPQYKSILRDIKGKDALCLASGGGQQSVILGLLGANVTVLDLTEEQLESDRRAAGHYGYDIRTIQGDMRDLSVFGDEEFDLAYQPISINFVPDVNQVYREVVRVLRIKGIYLVEFNNPATNSVEENTWDGKGYRISTPYKRGLIEQDEKWGAEFVHTLSDIFNGLINAGFIIKGVWEDPHNAQNNTSVKPGTYDHMLSYVQLYFAVLAQKSKKI